MTHGSLFSGIGAADLAAEWMGWENAFQCEIDKFCQAVLTKNFPNTLLHGNIKTNSFIQYRGLIDVLTGGFPCQPFSQTGLRKGTEDPRHLWPSMLRAIREIQPRWIVGENVLGIINWSKGMVFNQVQTDLEAAGYEVFPYVLPACSVNAPHRRDRVWFIAHARSDGHESGRFGEDKYTQGEGEGKQDKRERLRSDIGGTGEPGTASNTGIHGETASQRNDGEWSAEVRSGKGIKKHKPNGHGKPGITPDTEGHGDRRGLHGMEKEDGSVRKSKERGQDYNESGNDGEIRNAADTNSSVGREGRMHQTEREETERYTGTRDARHHGWDTWDNFPTQSPLCSGDDGISSGLDGITFSKWRSESIKALGNSMVPQVVFQIFQAIQQYEKLKK